MRKCWKHRLGRYSCYSSQRAHRLLCMYDTADTEAKTVEKTSLFIHIRVIRNRTQQCNKMQVKIIKDNETGRGRETKKVPK